MSLVGRAACALGLWLSWTFGSGCAGTEVGNPVEHVPLSLTARSSSADVALSSEQPLEGGADAGSPAVKVDELWVSLGDVRFVLDNDCSAQRDTRATLPGPIVAELAHAPTALAAQLPHANYCSVRVSFERADEASTSAEPELAGYSCLLRGTRADGVPFQIRSRDKPDLVLRAKNAPFVLSGKDSPVILAFDAAVWLDGVDLDGAETDAGGVITIEPGQQAPLLRQFEENLHRSLQLFRDQNADGTLDHGEATDALAL